MAANTSLRARGLRLRRFHEGHYQDELELEAFHWPAGTDPAGLIALQHFGTTWYVSPGLAALVVALRPRFTAAGAEDLAVIDGVIEDAIAEARNLFGEEYGIR